MKVILEKDIKGLGKKGEIVEVKEGYGRNYLLPRGLVKEATDGNIRQVNLEKKAEKNKRQRELEAAQAIADRINDQKIQIATKVGEAGKLFGSITTQDIAERLEKQYKVEIDRRRIDLSEPIKNLGNYPISIRIHPKVHANLTVQVVER